MVQPLSASHPVVEVSPPEARAARPVLRSRAWLVAALAANAAAISILWRAPSFWMETILPLLRPHVTRWYVGAGALIVAGLVRWAWSAGPVRRRAALAALAAVFAAYVLLLFGYYTKHDAPAKKFHLMEYGLLAGVTLQAVRVSREDPRGFVLALAFLLAVGTLDENLQRIIPMRTFKMADLLANFVGVALGTLAWMAASRHSPYRAP